MFQHVSETFIMAQYREYINPILAWVFQIMDGLLRDNHEIASFSRDRLTPDMKDHGSP